MTINKLFLTVSLLLLSGRVIAADKYTPTPETVPVMTRQQAETVIRNSPLTNKVNINFKIGGFDLVYRDNIAGRANIICNYEKMYDPTVLGPKKSVYIMQFGLCSLFDNEGKELFKEEGFRLAFETKETAINVANALFVLKHKLFFSASDPRSEESKFAEEARRYRELALKPALSEEARKFKVQAENAVAEKRFSDAAEIYGKALDLAPWWPEGYFNRALILGELGQYEEAVQSMQRYLLLVPEAPDARAAQDKIYVWQGKAGH